MGQVMHLTFTSSLSAICENNSSFDSGVLRVAYTGKNRNGSYISKETYEACLETIYNCPIVCRYDRESDSLGSHDIAVVKNADGGLSVVNMTDPIGVVPESAEPYWETVEEEDGTEHEYLCVEVLLWKRQEAYKKIKNDGISSESMEINVKSGYLDEDTGLFVIEKFEFTAFCLLGDGIEPCFESASLEVFSNAGFKSQLEQMMCDLKQTFSLGNEAINGNSPETLNHSTEGGNALDEKMKLVEEYGLSADELDFSIDELSIDELREKFEAMKNASETADSVQDATDQTGKHEEFELSCNVYEALSRALNAVVVHECWGDTPRYWYVDRDEETKTVYCEDRTQGWALYGFTYSMDGDNAVVDFDSGKRMKWAIVEYDEGSIVSPTSTLFELASQRYTENDSAWSQKYQDAESKITTMKAELSELTELREFKKTADADAAKAARDAVFERFSDLDGIEAYEALKGNCADMDVETLEEKCFALRGRNGTQMNFAHKERATKIVVEHGNQPEQEPYGGLIAKFCKISG